MSATIVRETGDSVTFDATIRESHEISVQVSDHHIEDGAPVTDHAQPKPHVFTLTLLTSETPLRQPALRAFLAPIVGTFPLESVPNRVLETWEFLRSIAEARELVDVITPKFGLISDALITRIPLEINNVNAGRWSIAFRVPRFAERVTVQIPPLRPSEVAQDGAPDEQDTGVQPTENPEDVTEAEDSSILFDLGETLGFL